MQRKILLIMLLFLSFSFIACGKKDDSQREDIETGEIKEVQTEHKQEKENEDLDIKSDKLSDLYSKEENRSLYMPDDYFYTDETNKIKYERKNIPEFGISALIPEGFKVLSNPELYRENFSSMVSLYGNTEKTKGIQISFYARPEQKKGKEFIQQMFYDDIMNNFSYVDKGSIYTLIALKLGDLEEKYSDKDVYISTINNDYVEMTSPVSGLNNIEGKKLLRWTETPEEFRVTERKGGKTKSFLTFINYGIVFDQGVLTITSAEPGKEELAEDINNIVAESIAYIDKDQTTNIFSNRRSDYKINNMRTLKVPENMKQIKSSSFSSLYISDDADKEKAITKPSYLFTYYQQVQPNNPEILNHFKGLTQFKAEFNQRFSTRKQSDKTGLLAVYQTGDYFRSGASVVEGYYETTVNETDDKGIYKAVYFEDTGEIYVLMMNSDRFTENIREKELSYILEGLL